MQVRTRVFIDKPNQAKFSKRMKKCAHDNRNNDLATYYESRLRQKDEQHKEERNAHNAELTRLKNQHAIELADLDQKWTQKHESAMTEIQKSFADAIANIHIIYSNNTQAMQRNHDEHIAVMSQKHAADLTVIQNDTQQSQQLTQQMIELSQMHQELGQECEILRQKVQTLENLKQEFQELKQKVYDQKLELDRHAGVSAEKRAIHARGMRLEYVQKLERAYKVSTGEKKLSPPVAWLIKDFLGNELIEDISERPLMVSKVAFEQERYDLHHNDLLKIGIIASDKYLATHGNRPPKYPRFVNGNPNIEVNIYTTQDRWIIEDAIKKYYCDGVM